jgi:hypothetical protein
MTDKAAELLQITKDICQVKVKVTFSLEVEIEVGICDQFFFLLVIL